MKTVVLSIAFLFAVIVFVYAQGNGIVNKIGKEQMIQIASGLTNGMLHHEVENYLTNAGVRPNIGWIDRSNFISTTGYAFTNAGTYTVRWKDPSGVVKSAEQPNRGGFVVQFTNGFLYSAYIGDFSDPTNLKRSSNYDGTPHINIKLKDSVKKSRDR